MATMEINSLLQNLDKVVKTAMLYGNGHTQVERGLEHLKKNFEDILRETPEIELELFRSQLRLDTEVVFQSEKLEKNYLIEMYYDGIRSLHFERGLTLEELKNIVKVFSRDLETMSTREEDTSTLFWKFEFKHFNYTMVDAFDGSMHIQIKQNEMLDDLENEELSRRQVFEKVISSFEGNDNMSLQKVASKNISAEAIEPVAFSNPEELLEFWKKQSLYSPGDEYLSDIANIYGELIERSIDDEDWQELILNYIVHLKTFFLEGHIEMALFWLETYMASQSILINKSNQQAIFMKQSIGELSDPELFREIGKRYSRGLPGSVELWINFFSLLESKSCDGICELVAQVDIEVFHTRIVDFLTTFGADQTDIFIKQSRRSEIMIVIDMIRVLKKLLSPNMLADVLRPLSIHEHQNVREEVAKCVELLPEISRKTFLARFLRDSNDSIRMMALKSLDHHQYRDMVNVLVDELKKDSFLKRKSIEQKRWFQVIIKIAKEQSLELIELIIQNNRMPLEIKSAAIHALDQLPLNIAKEFLRKMSRKAFFQRAIKSLLGEMLDKLDRKGSL
ncbi:MAG: hypothetical protein KDD48_03650 [Bdellovibrionales bacterium]|nr:hypothetical protein [Bdellovibrionales bacterium]